MDQRRFYSWMEWGCANSKRIANLWSIQWSPTSRHHWPNIFPSSSISSFKQTHKSQVYESGSGMYTFISSVSVFKANLHLIPHAAHSLHSAPVVSLRFEPLHQIKLGCRRSVLLLVHSNVFQNLNTIKPQTIDLLSSPSRRCLMCSLHSMSSWSPDSIAFWNISSSECSLDSGSLSHWN